MLLSAAACTYHMRDLPPEDFGDATATADDDSASHDDDDLGGDAGGDGADDGDTVPTCTVEVMNGVDDDCDGFVDECLNCDCSGVQVCFPFDEDTSNHANATVSSLEDDVGLVPISDGALDGAMHFGDTSELGSSDAGELEGFKPVTQITVEMWIRPTAVPTTQRQGLFDQNGRYSMYMEVGGVLECRRSGVFDSAAGTIASGSWQHVACVFDGLTGQAYVDGVLVATGTLSTFSTGVTETHIGSNANLDGTYDERFIGDLDNVRIWDKALTADEIEAIAN